MEKIIVIGSPGSGKSTLSKRLSKMLKFPLLHLDRVYHIDNENQISKDELIGIISNFTSSNKRWIIDGNYNSTLEERTMLSDTIIFMKIPTSICLENIHKRSKEFNDKGRSDMAEGFDDSIMDDDFEDFVRNFKKKKHPFIKGVLEKYEKKTVIELNSYEEMERFLEKAQEERR